MTNFDIRNAVRAALEAMSDVNCTAIGVAVHKGVEGVYDPLFLHGVVGE